MEWKKEGIFIVHRSMASKHVLSEMQRTDQQRTFQTGCRDLPPHRDHKGHQKSPMQTPSMQSAMLEEAAIGTLYATMNNVAGSAQTAARHELTASLRSKGRLGRPLKFVYICLFSFLVELRGKETHQFYSKCSLTCLIPV